MCYSKNGRDYYKINEIQIDDNTILMGIFLVGKIY